MPIKSLHHGEGALIKKCQRLIKRTLRKLDGIAMLVQAGVPWGVWAPTA